MRYAELLFLILLVLYQAVLLVPRHRRLFSANYLVFLAGMALAWNLGIEGLRWQTIPAILLLLIDLAVLFPSFARLRGRIPPPGIVSALVGTLRFLVSFSGLVIALGSALLSVAFPLPSVELTGGLTASHRVVRFPPASGYPGLDLRVWYPAAGDARPLPQPSSEPEVWQRVQRQGGLPVFWQSYLEHLPTPLVVGGRIATPKTKYPVIYVVTPPGQDGSDFSFLWEDLASRGFVVAAGSPVPPQPVPARPFDWGDAWTEIGRPLSNFALWLEPETTLSKPAAADFDLLGPSRLALKQLDSEPGDVFFDSIDWSHQGLWAWGSGPGLPDQKRTDFAIQGLIRAGVDSDAEKPQGLELWISAQPFSADGPKDQWVLTVPRLQRADLADSAYLKPYLAFFGLKSHADAAFHGVIREYQAAFYQYAFWNRDAGVGFGQTVPSVPGLKLAGH